MVDGANICSREGQTILWMKADSLYRILILNSELWDSNLEV